MLHYWLGGYWPVLGIIPTIIVTFPLDKMLDDKYKQLRAIDGGAPGDTAACAECHRLFNIQDMIAHNGVHVCAHCKPIFLQKLAEGAKIASTPDRGKP